MSFANHGLSVVLQLMLVFIPIWAAVVGTLSLVMAFARTGPDEARSKLSEWAELVRLKKAAAWLRKHSLDSWVLKWGKRLMPILLFIGGGLIGRVIFPLVLPMTPPLAEPPLSSHGPLYMTNFSVGYSNREADPIIAVGVYAITTERLRVFVDYAANFFDNQPMLPSGRVPIATLVDPVKGRDTEIALVRKEHVQGIGDYWWGDPALRRQFPGENHAPFYTVFGRLVIVGPDNGEQHYCFRVAWLMDTTPKRQFFISQSDIADWKKGWECQNDR